MCGLNPDFFKANGYFCKNFRYFLNHAPCPKISATNCSKEVALKEREDIETKRTAWDGIGLG